MPIPAHELVYLAQPKPARMDGKECGVKMSGAPAKAKPKRGGMRMSFLRAESSESRAEACRCFARIFRPAGSIALSSELSASLRVQSVNSSQLALGAFAEHFRRPGRV